MIDGVHVRDILGKGIECKKEVGKRIYKKMYTNANISIAKAVKLFNEYVAIEEKKLVKQ